ncbi:hypothetical protein [uncultured Deinococcus sp.]|uniref:GNAT family N-acetyltransferase n=1 Tax=uncultured Deinococcus sp. TaxID=158789 RepID=UPI0025D78749|nr:hypothetical protein [uncultured Deinococcus sp.]
MSATQLHRPEPRTAPVDLRVLPDTDEVWVTVVDEQVACLDPRTGEPEAEYRTFKEGQFRRCRAMVRAGLGAWYGAFVNGRLAADLGVFTDGAELLRFQAVNTHPDFRRRGRCSALTHFAGTHAQRVFGGHQLVIVADDHDVAKGIYERVGVRVVERQRLLLKRPPTS